MSAELSSKQHTNQHINPRVPGLTPVHTGSPHHRWPRNGLESPNATAAGLSPSPSFPRCLRCGSDRWRCGSDRCSGAAAAAAALDRRWRIAEARNTDLDVRSCFRNTSRSEGTSSGRNEKQVTGRCWVTNAPQRSARRFQLNSGDGVELERQRPQEQGVGTATSTSRCHANQHDASRLREQEPGVTRKKNRKPLPSNGSGRPEGP